MADRDTTPTTAQLIEQLEAAHATLREKEAASREARHAETTAQNAVNRLQKDLAKHLIDAHPAVAQIVKVQLR